MRSVLRTLAKCIFWYHENAGLGERLPGCWLGVSHRVGSLMLDYVLTGKCTVISRTTVQQVTNLGLQVDGNKVLFKEFDQEVRRILGEEEPQQDIGDKPSPEDWAEFVEFDKDFQEKSSAILSAMMISRKLTTSLLRKSSMTSISTWS